ncbi:AAA family ATPase [Pseudaestuariivita atlantica]|uniref:Cell division protein ZipA n=1 Tax=Pseudaestuariivita atlantica TaxID=1317121 RepID=A0A0L1JMU5_9RHOB|nr:ATP-binding protein [Pseudaestuariivita atlantica]KNG93076.1 cell division protein ZipA [Pseudaestuariivita atlantica]
MPSDPAPLLHMLCGKMASGKSTLAGELARAPNTVLISEDDWLGALYPDEIEIPRDYVRAAGRLQAAMGPHVERLLRAGMSVVLDFPANTRANRVWMRDVIEAAGVAHRLHYLHGPDDVLLQRLRARNASGAHPFAPTEEQFHLFARHFEPPSLDEGFSVVEHPITG